jgi:hypothetical protein
MTNHPKFTESHDSAARKSSSRTSTGSRKKRKKRKKRRSKLGQEFDRYNGVTV